MGSCPFRTAGPRVHVRRVDPEGATPGLLGSGENSGAFRDPRVSLPGPLSAPGASLLHTQPGAPSQGVESGSALCPPPVLSWGLLRRAFPLASLSSSPFPPITPGFSS